jgi:hypothetical protein
MIFVKEFDGLPDYSTMEHLQRRRKTEKEGHFVVGSRHIHEVKEEFSSTRLPP